MSSQITLKSSASDAAAGKHQDVFVPPRGLKLIFYYGPTLLVLAALAAIGAYGQSVHWKLPKFAELVKTSEHTAEDWCEAHAVPASQCVECNPGKFPGLHDYGWCVEHGIHNCVLHHPDLAQTKTLPDSLSSMLSHSLGVLALQDRLKNNAACKLYQHRIQFASLAAVEQAGVDVELAETQTISEGISGNGELSYDATRVARLSSKVSGTAWQVLKNIGDPVQKGDVLAIVDAMEVGRLKTDFVKAMVTEELAKKNVARLSGIASGAITQRQILETEAALAEALASTLAAEQALANLGLRIDVTSLRELPQQEIFRHLRFLGLPAALAAQIEDQTATSNLLPIFSPMNGVVTERTVVAGETVDSARMLFQVVDPKTMWLTISIPLEHVHALSLGQVVRFLPNGSHNEVSGPLTWISTSVDPQTRMVKVRADVSNADGKLFGETYGAGSVMLRENDLAVTVPRSAVNFEGCCQVVFVRDKDYFASPDSPKVFHVRTVRTGAINNDRVEIIAGVLPNEVVATTGSDVLRAQLLKGGLGAGCCAE